MAKRRKIHSFLNNRDLRSNKFRYETLEVRAAPGTLLDIVGTMNSVVQELDRSTSWEAREFSSQSVPRAVGLGASSETPSSLRSINRQLPECYSASRTLPAPGSDPSVDLQGFANGPGGSQRSPKGFGKDWAGSAFDASSLSDYLTAANLNVVAKAESVPLLFSGSWGSGHASSSADLFGPTVVGVGSSLPAQPAMSMANLGADRFGAPGGWQGLSQDLLAAGLDPSTVFAALQSTVSDTAGLTSEPLPADALTADQHRLPPELRGRSDDRLVGQSLIPYSVENPMPLRGPTSGVVRSPAEYEPMRGVLFSYASYPTIVTDMVKELTEDPATDDIAYVVVTSESQQTTATSSFISAGANINRVQFFVQPMNSVWMRDYGPHFITVDHAPAIVDSHYYPTRPLDNFVPTLVGDNNFNVPTYDVGLYFSGGNFQPGPNRSGFLTSIINRDNPTADGFDTALIAELHQKYLGIDTLHVLPALPTSVDGTGHIDMWMYLVDQDTVIISEFLPGSNSTAIEITNNAVGFMQNLGFQVFRTPAWNSGGTHFTYANAFRVNNRIFVPVYGTALKPGGNSTYNSRDTSAIEAWQAAAGPGVEIVPIQCSQIIPAAGAIHCIVKQVPRYTGNAPAVNIVSPAGGEILSRSVPFKLEWSAIDTNNTEPVEIKIYVSNGDGTRYRQIATTTDSGSYLWTPGATDLATSARFKIAARSANGSITEVVSNPISISKGNLSTYDFSSGAGVNRFAYGSQTASWSSVNANSFPVNAQLTSTNYARLATSNAVGGNNSDTNRYIAPVPSPTSNESTHLFTFQLPSPASQLAQLEVLWEGYANNCTQVELYVWDLILQNWGSGTGLAGVNRYMDSWAGNLDGSLTGAIRTNFSRYVDESGFVRFLVYTDRPGAVGSTGQGIGTFHDYMSVKAKLI